MKRTVKGLLLITSILLCQCTSSNVNNEHKKPDSNRFEIEVVAEGLNQPMSMDILKDGRVLFVEKEGSVKVYNPSSSKINTIAKLPVNARYNQPYTTSGSKYDADDGMHGVVVDPDFDQNHYIYLYYSPESDAPKSVIARYKWEGDSLNMDSKKVLLEWGTQREICCHLGGGMIFDHNGNLLVAVGGNSGFNMENRYGDPRRTAGNTNDLRGAILRIKPEADGTYTIPEGNLFSEDTSKARPEIYIMGVRNPWRLSIDNKSGWLYWGEVGPSLDEFNQARKAGNYGWPFFIANNKKSLNIKTDYDTTNIINDSPYNTGLTELPSPPVPALVWYDRNPSEFFPVQGSGSLSAVGGPFYRRSDFTDAARPFPEYYNGKWFVTDYVRGWIMTIELDDKGNYKSMEEFFPEGTFTGINDMDFGSEGDLYVLQYGHDSYEPYAEDAKLFRIKYNDGNRKPIAKASANRTAGSVPLEIALSSEGTIDFDKNLAQYEWRIESNREDLISSQEANPVINLDEAGIYKATLTVTDSEGAKDSSTIEITAGNEPPMVGIEFAGSNKSFYFPGDQIEYSVQINDKEDAKIEDSRINVWSDYLPNSYDIDEFVDTLKSSATLLPARSILGRQLIDKNNCYQCHSLNQTAVGPSFTDIAQHYQKDDNVYQRLSNKIIEGSSGEWGQAEMPAHPSITEDEARSIVDYIMNSIKGKDGAWSLPLEGSISVSDPNEGGYLLFKSSYKDNGNNGIPPIETIEVKVLRNPRIFVSEADTSVGMRKYIPHFKQPTHLITQNSPSYVGLKDIDLTGVSGIGLDIIDFDQIEDSSWQISIRSDSVNGDLIGQSKLSDFEHKEDGLRKMKINSVANKKDIFIIINSKEYINSENKIEIRSIKFYK